MRILPVFLKVVYKRASIEDYRNGGQNSKKLNFPFTRVTCSGVVEDERHELPTAPPEANTSGTCSPPEAGTREAGTFST